MSSNSIVPSRCFLSQMREPGLVSPTMPTCTVSPSMVRSIIVVGSLCGSPVAVSRAFAASTGKSVCCS